MQRRACITGAADTPVGKLPEHTCMSLLSLAARGAIEDARLTALDIDGVLAAYSFTQPHLMLASLFCEYFGLQPQFATALQAGGATACTAIMTAAALVEANVCQNILIVTGDNRLTGLRSGEATAILSEVGHPEFEQPYGVSVPAAYALVAQRYMHEYGVEPEHLAAIAVTQRAHAALHPHAHMRSLITVDDVMNSRLICEPLRLLDCCLISDGGAAVVVSAREHPSSAEGAIFIRGVGQGHTNEHITWAPSLNQLGCEASARRAFQRAGITPANIDVAEIYDSFTITLAVELESMGFFPEGEAARAATAGELSLTGSLPCNTHGGLLSYGHSGAAGGMFHVVESVRQLRGAAGNRQVDGAQFAFVHGDGGILSAHCSLVLERT